MLTIHRDTERLARLIAARGETTAEEVVRLAVETLASATGLVRSPAAPEAPRQAKVSVMDAAARAELIAAMEAIAARSAARPSVDPRSIDEIVGYDDLGLPR